MELISRHRNLTILVTVLVVQVLGLAVQVKRPTDRGSIRLVRLWAIRLVTPVEHAVVHTHHAIYDVWRNYFYLRDVRRENDRLREENLHLRLEQVRMAEDAGQAQRLQALLKFKEQFISQTVAAQVIGSSGSESSRLVYIDKGSRDGIKTDMAVISPAGIVGKVVDALPTVALVLQINDASSGIGAMLEKSRLQGILKGTPSGEMMLHYVMTDERVEVGENVITSGGDRIFPKGLFVGRVVQVSPGPEAFLNIRVQPAARLERLEEVLVITRVDEKQPEAVPVVPKRAADILAERLPTIPVKPPEIALPAVMTAPPGSAAASGAITPVKANAPNAGAAKPPSPGNKQPETPGGKPILAVPSATVSSKPNPAMPGATARPSVARPDGSAIQSGSGVKSPGATPGGTARGAVAAPATKTTAEPSLPTKAADILLLPSTPAAAAGTPNAGETQPAKPAAETQTQPKKEDPR